MHFYLPSKGTRLKIYGMMRRVTSKILLLFLGIAFIVVYCEFLIYYVVIAQIQGTGTGVSVAPKLNKYLYFSPIYMDQMTRDLEKLLEDVKVIQWYHKIAACFLWAITYCNQCSWLALNSSEPVLKALILSDVHLLGPYKGNIYDKIRREWQMHRAFQTIITLHNPEIVFILGDLFDEGDIVTDYELELYAKRFYSLFALPQHIKMYVVAGNHDIGFHYRIKRRRPELFTKLMNATTVQFLTVKENNFVLLNSVAMEGDYCTLCSEARREIDRISETLKCSENPDYCPADVGILQYSRPILLQHFPLYRLSEEPCTEPDSAPSWEKKIKFRLKIDALSKEATDYLVSKLKPRLVIGGHTHHGCKLYHEYGDVAFWEHSVPSFSWRNRLNPKFMLVTISPDEYAVNKCGLPTEVAIVSTAVFMLAFLIYLLKRKNYKRDWHKLRYN